MILLVGGELIRGKRHDILLVLRTPALSCAAMVLTFLATTQLPLQQAIVLGAVLSLLLYCAQAARQARFLGGRLILAGVTPGLGRVLRMTGIDGDLSPGGVVPAEGAVFDPLDRALEDARAWIADRAGTTTAGADNRHEPPAPPP
ncbi:hypothetical protein ACFC09_01295 [Streptomyces sp. NPDC056161]|uniref:hypothetical protein n=1 Tax=Streptomyces sp. NPDC056161 TaxID=3345732 RepID=UPI0035DA4BF1